MTSDTLGQAVASFLGKGDDQGFVALAEQHAGIITAMAHAYTRGQGFTALGEPNDEIEAVIVCAAARLASNPSGLRQQTGSSRFGVVWVFTPPGLTSCRP